MRKHYFYIIFTSILLFSCRESGVEPNDESYQWKLSSPEAQGMSSQKLDSAFIITKQLGFVDGLVIIRNGYLIKEAYYNGFSRTTAHYIWSCTKSFMSALVGIVIRDGVIESLDKKIMDYFPEYAYSGMDPRFYDITIRHLLTMTMGIDAEEKVMIPVLQTNDWIRETLKLPLLYDPGTRFSYNSLQPHLLSAIITKKLE
jgi:CubicO group peptidase (beta-lactamase class C family)